MNNDDKQRMDGMGQPAKPATAHKHFHDQLHPGGVQGVRTTPDTEGSQGSQSGPQPSGGRTGLTEHVGGVVQPDTFDNELNAEEIGHFSEGKPASGTPLHPGAPKDFKH